MDEVRKERWERLSVQAEAWRRAGQAQRLAEAGRDLVGLDPEQELGYRCLADAAELRGDLPTALRHIHEALGRAPEWYWLHYRLASLRLANGERPAAELATREALRLAPEQPDTWVLLARIALEEDDHDGAAMALERALRLDPEHVASLGVSADLVVERGGSAAEELAFCERALASDPESSYAHSRTAHACLRVPDLDRAEAHAREALRLDPADRGLQDLLFSVLRRRYRLYRWLRAPGQALGAAWDAWTRVPIWAYVLLVLARVAFILLAVMLAATVAWLLFIWPVLSIYQVFVVADVRRQAGVVGHAGRRGWGPLGWPMPVRMTAFVLLSALVWAGVAFALVQDGAMRVLGWVVVGTFLLALLAGWYLTWRDAVRRRRRRRALRSLEGAG
jgi:tetratricopeptide (TPR) repeat protein